MQWPKPFGKVQTLGLIESVTYTAAVIHSPSKKSHDWNHQFGDYGERGHGKASSSKDNRYHVRLFPRLDKDSAGNLFVVRRSGNRYLVQEWIIG
jgi:hypothetical protein